MRTYLRNISFLAIALLLMGRPAIAQEKIKIGVSVPLSGGAATYGVDVKNSLLFANEKLANNKYEFLFEDDVCNGKSAVSIAHKFIDVLGLKYVTGFACSGTVLPSAPLYERGKVLTMVTCASAAEIAKSGDFVFRTAPNDKFGAKELYKHIQSKHKSIGMLSEETDYCQGFYNSFVENNSNAELTIYNENFLSESKDFRTLLLRLQTKKVEAVFINTQTEEGLLNVLRQFKQLKISLPIYAAYWPSAATILDKSKDLVEGVEYVDVPELDRVLTEEGRSLYDEFKSKYGKLNSIDLIFGSVFEGFRALHQAIDSGQEVRGYLYKTRFDGIFGPWWFDKDGEIQGLRFQIKKIENGKPKVIS